MMMRAAPIASGFAHNPAYRHPAMYAVLIATLMVASGSTSTLEWFVALTQRVPAFLALALSSVSI